MERPSSELNNEQTRASNHTEGPMLVLAGAGSGKTRIVTHRILHLIEIGVPPSQILAVTFTNKAAEEMKHRVLHLARAQVLTSTFHSLCAKILRESISSLGYGRDFLILDEEDADKSLKQCFASLGIKDDKSLVKTTRGQISNAKNRLLMPEDLPKEEQGLQEIYQCYQNKLKQYNALDFDDLLFLTVKLFQDFPEVLSIYQDRWKYILIDEYQDTNQAQYLLIKLLSACHDNVFAVGDPDQSIYSWRGANIQNILNFESDYSGAEIVRLEQNYRSCNTILEAANALIKYNESRYEKNLWSNRESGEKLGLFIAENERQEADFVSRQIKNLHIEKGIEYQDCAVFYRTNFQSRTFEDALLREKIPYVVIGGLSFYKRKEIKDVLSLLRMILSSSDFIAFSRTINQPRRGLGLVALEKIREKSLEMGLEIFTLCEQVVDRKVNIGLSAKQVKGLEEYVSCICALREMHKAGRPLSEILVSGLERSRYIQYLQEDSETFQEKKENIEELVAKTTEWEEEATDPSLTLFLEELALKSSSEDPDKMAHSIRLMTIHNGKGLEFPLVFLVGMEEDLFPHINSKDSPEKVEEERRLCYVGITRAKDHLFLTASKTRFLWGASRMMRPSRFLKEIPPQYVQKLSLYGNQSKSSYTSSFEVPEKSEGFAPGDTVIHGDFGTGTVHKAYQTSLGLTYDVFFFKSKTVRTLAAKYAKLKQG
jgi:DNA helicase II / ATP-dependent DNA helicase PcrA